MKKLFTLLALGAASTLLADNSYYQGQSSNSQWPTQTQYGNPQGQLGNTSSGSQGQYGMPQGSQGQYGMPQGQGGQYNQTPNPQITASDKQLSRKIYDALGSEWRSKGFQNLTFEIYDGNVHLRGSVATPEAKSKAEEIISRIAGVKSVENHLAIANDGSTNATDADSKSVDIEKKFPQDSAATESDRILNGKIREKLKGGWLSKGFDALIIRTNNGAVTIVGVVDSDDDIKKINEKVKDIPGIKSLNNQVTSKK